MTEPLTVESVKGNKVVLRREDGTKIENAHVENCVIVPETATDLEREPLQSQSWVLDVALEFPSVAVVLVPTCRHMSLNRN